MSYDVSKTHKSIYGRLRKASGNSTRVNVVAGPSADDLNPPWSKVDHVKVTSQVDLFHLRSCTCSELDDVPTT